MALALVRSSNLAQATFVNQATCRRYLIGLMLTDPVSGDPPGQWTYTALPGSHVSVEVHKTERIA